MDPSLLADGKVIIIDKPPGMTSHETTTFVKKIIGARRTGHAGTLDPDVSGVLPVAIGRATKLLRYIAGKEKTYVGLMKFKNIQSKKDVESLFKRFTGVLVQTPPKISAVRKVPRKRTVYYLKLLELDGRLALFETRVDAGTYIRTLCDDMGKEVGGARMIELRRIAVGRIRERETNTMQELTDAIWFAREKDDGSRLSAMLKPPESFIELPKAQIKPSALSSIISGAQIMVPAVEKMDPAVKKDERVAIYCEGKFIGIGIAIMTDGEIRQAERGLAIKLERVQK